MKKEQMRNLLEKIEAMNQKQDRELADSVLQVSISANKQVVEELRGDETMCQALWRSWNQRSIRLKQMLERKSQRKSREKQQ